MHTEENETINLTVPEYAETFGIPVNTVRTKIKRDKLPTLKAPDDKGKMTTYIPVEPSSMPTARVHEPQMDNAKLSELLLELELLRSELQEEKIKNARFEGLEIAFEAQQKTIEAHELANFGLNQERISLNTKIKVNRHPLRELIAAIILKLKSY